MLPLIQVELIHKMLKEVEKMEIELQKATFSITEITYQELKEIQSALSKQETIEAFELQMQIEDSLCCLL